MQTQIIVRNTDASEYHRRYAQEELSRLFRVHRRIKNARVVLTEDGLNKKAEVTVSVPGQHFHATGAAENIEAAVARCVACVRRSLIRYKSFVRSKDPRFQKWR